MRAESTTPRDGLRPRAHGLRVLRLGHADYGDTLARQEALRDEVLAGAPDVLVLVEHPPVITLGRRGDERHVLAPTAPVVRVSRGGDVTWHGPGQLVGYPILDLCRHGADLHRYLRALEDVLIATAAELGVAAARRPGMTGVWVGNDKLGAIGVGIRRWVSMHGFSLNVGDVREAFAAIVPCGLAGTGVTSLSAEAGAALAVTAVEPLVVRHFLARFGCEILPES